MGKEVKVGVGITSIAFMILLIIYCWFRELSSLLPSEMFWLGLIAFAIGLGVSIAIRVGYKQKTDYNLMGISMLLFFFMLWAFIGDVAIGTMLISSLVFVLLIVTLIGILLAVILYLLFNPDMKSKGRKSMRCGVGVTSLAFLILLVVLNWNLTIAELMVSTIFWLVLISFAIGLGVSLGFQFGLKHKTNYNLMGTVLVLYAFLMWWLIGDVAIGTILVSSLVYISIITMVVAVIIWIILYMFIK